MELDNKFHEVIYGASNSKILEHVLVIFHHYLQKNPQNNLADPKRTEHSNREHRQFLMLRKKNDGGTCRKAVFMIILKKL